MTPEPTELDLRLLAYADGELDAAGRARVDAAAATDPTVADRLRDLQATSPREGVRAAVAPDPHADTWTILKSQIEAKLPLRKPAPVVAPRSSWRAVRYSLAALCAVAAVVLFSLRLTGVIGTRPQPVEPLATETIDLLAEYDDLPIATADDVMISRIGGDGVGTFITVRHPVPSPVPFARKSELVVPEKMAVLQPPVDVPAEPDPFVIGIADGVK